MKLLTKKNKKIIIRKRYLSTFPSAYNAIDLRISQLYMIDIQPQVNQEKEQKAKKSLPIEYNILH